MASDLAGRRTAVGCAVPQALLIAQHACAALAFFFPDHNTLMFSGISTLTGAWCSKQFLIMQPRCASNRMPAVSQTQSNLIYKATPPTGLPACLRPPLLCPMSAAAFALRLGCGVRASASASLDRAATRCCASTSASTHASAASAVSATRYTPCVGGTVGLRVACMGRQ